MTTSDRSSNGHSEVICVFGSSQAPEGSVAYEEARLTGSLLAREGYRVCCGGYGGTMEGVCRGAKEAGGATIGVTTAWFSQLSPNRWVDEEIRTDTYVERLCALIDKGAAYLALQGGVGTLTEISLVWSLLQTRSVPPRPLVLLHNPWQGLIDLAGESFILRTGELDLAHVASTPQDAVRLISALLRAGHA